MGGCMNDFKVVLPFKMLTDTDKEKWRHDTFWSKEPETIEWIKSFNDGDLFFDIGANIGVYTLYFASLYPKGLVIAVEPVPFNYLKLRTSVGLNKFSNVMVETAIFSDTIGKVPLFVPDIEAGASGAQAFKPIDEHGNQFKEIQYAIDVTSFTFNEYIKLFNKKPHDFDRPTHIKIDIDGQEDKVLAGIKDFKNIKSLLIEMNFKGEGMDNTFDIKMLSDAGFTADNKFNKLENHSRNRRKGNPENVIFTKEK